MLCGSTPMRSLESSQSETESTLVFPGPGEGGEPVFSAIAAAEDEVVRGA